MIPKQTAEIRGKTTYQKWLESEGIPVLREFYIPDIREVPLHPGNERAGVVSI